MIIERFSLGVTAEALRAEIDRKSAISLHFDPKFQVKGVAPTYFRTDSYRPMNAWWTFLCYLNFFSLVVTADGQTDRQNSLL